MNKNRLIKVAQEHIDRGMPEFSSACMVAEAVKDAVPGSQKVHVDLQTIRYTDAKGVRRTYLTPSSAQAALVRFDAGDPVDPFNFHLNQLMHITKPHNVTLRSQHLKRDETVRAGNTRSRVGGRAVPIMGNTTRRKFGIRGLRINQELKVVQTGVTK